MNKDSVIQYLTALGVKNIRDSGGDWVNFSCPLAHIKHSSGSDFHPSAGASCSDTSRSIWLCYTCTQESQPIEHLLHTSWLSSGVYPSEAARIFGYNEVLYEEGSTVNNISVPDIWDGWENERCKASLPVPVVQYFPLVSQLNGDEYSKVTEFLCNKRGINPGVLDIFGVRYCKEFDSVVFGLTLHSGEVVVLRMRNITEKSMLTVTPDMFGLEDIEFPRVKDTGAWFGLHLIDWLKPVMLVEGELDCMRLYSLGFTNVIASCTSSVAPSQINALCGLNYILGFDSDEAGKKGNEKIIKQLYDFVSLSIAKWPDKDPGNLKSKRELEEVLKSLKLIKKT